MYDGTDREMGLLGSSSPDLEVCGNHSLFSENQQEIIRSFPKLALIRKPAC